jgi:hypothetical protein
LIAGKFAVFELLDEWFEVGVDFAVAFSEGAGGSFEFIGNRPPAKVE